MREPERGGGNRAEEPRLVEVLSTNQGLDLPDHGLTLRLFSV
jgi:hypothetical protein